LYELHETRHACNQRANILPPRRSFCLCPSASEEDEGWSDDEDTSWKVRRAAAKAISAVITHFPDLLAEVSAGEGALLGSRGVAPLCWAAGCCHS
jgi:hypothetical protein